MPAKTAAGRRVCYRCRAPLVDVAWARLTATHRNDADRYADVEEPICVDCFAGIGLLAFAQDCGDQSTGSRRGPTSRRSGRYASSARSRRHR